MRGNKSVASPHIRAANRHLPALLEYLNVPFCPLPSSPGTVSQVSAQCVPVSHIVGIYICFVAIAS
jgi:hypothetical protein